MHKKNAFICGARGNHIEFQGQIKVILIEKHEQKFMNWNHAEIRNRAIICNKNIKKMWFWRSFFVLLMLKTRGDDIVLSDRFELAHTNIT